VRKLYPIQRGVLRRTVGHVHAVDGVDLAIHGGRTLGLVGESGSGKSTLGRLVLRLVPVTEGSIAFQGEDITATKGTELRRLRRNMQMVFQDPYSSFDPMASVGASIAEPLRTHLKLSRGAIEPKVRGLLQMVGLDPSMLTRYPHEFSGGQLQRVAVARAIALRPTLLVLDEPVSSLDVSTQAEVINLLAGLQRELGLALLFIAHDLTLVRHVSSSIAVMNLGEIVEHGEASAVYDQPKHPYTQALLTAIPIPDPGRQRNRKRIVLDGEMPSPAHPPPGCRFHTRCPYVMEPLCRTVAPGPLVTPDGTIVRCHLHTAGPRLNGASVTTLPAPHRGIAGGAHG
jgi:oligopeptide/dipeptide ABC transporter ATP-binding protein